MYCNNLTRIELFYGFILGHNSDLHEVVEFFKWLSTENFHLNTKNLFEKLTSSINLVFFDKLKIQFKLFLISKPNMCYYYYLWINITFRIFSKALYLFAKLLVM